MSVIFKRFETVAIKKNLASIVNNIQSLLQLLSDPWGNTTITRILQGETCPEEEGQYETKVDVWLSVVAVQSLVLQLYSVNIFIIFYNKVLVVSQL